MLKDCAGYIDFLVLFWINNDQSILQMTFIYFLSFHEESSSFNMKIMIDPYFAWMKLIRSFGGPE